jgi:hypothetical protein
LSHPLRRERLIVEHQQAKTSLEEDWMGWQSIEGWRSAQVSGKSIAIPRVCPNCMQAGDTPFRTKFKRGTVSYLQTFYYCPQCATVLKYEQWRRRLWWPGPMYLAVAVMGALGFTKVNYPQLLPTAVYNVMQGPPGDPFAAVMAAAAVFLVALGVPLIFTVIARSKKLPPNALGRRPAAFCFGPVGLLQGYLGTSTDHRYGAPRPEWLTLLAQANQRAP